MFALCYMLLILLDNRIMGMNQPTNGVLSMFGKFKLALAMSLFARYSTLGLLGASNPLQDQQQQQSNKVQ